jgi:hypothetical protein
MEFKNTRVMNFEGAFRGLRNPKNSWHLSDSKFAIASADYEGDYDVADEYMAMHHPELKWPEDYSEEGKKLYELYIDKLNSNGTLQLNNNIGEFAFIGPKDMKLAQTLIAAGPEHRKFLRQIFVSVDITAPLYW